MVETMTVEMAYAILGVPMGSNFVTTAKAFRALRDKYNPEKNPSFCKEFAKVIAAFEFLQQQF
ncbi:MAG TPA: J domain-containing protein [Methanocorpusculum sp.]|nr:J domain-containing protein [Methanocorpusculum sp.]HJK00870.1 J domain-containing protein [Methanocorpusculum sp.]HJK01974.1 J domain-containing protein [Methanocorpusculum sp.]